MAAVLLGSFLLVKLFADFCESQVEPKDSIQAETEAGGE